MFSGQQGEESKVAFFPYQGKQVFYEELGQGAPVIFLHGNTASARMFELLMPLYTDKFHCVLIDFLGNGRSDRVNQFPADLWQDQAGQVIALAEYLRMGKTGLIGTSGGAWAALNAALKRPDLFCAVTADSFDGRTLHDQFAENLIAERAAARQDPLARQFYQWCQGDDWEQVVERDTEALSRCAREQRPLFCHPLNQLKVPVLLMGSRTDKLCRDNLKQEYEAMAALIPNAVIHFFEDGGHPAIVSNAEAAAEMISDFFHQHSFRPFEAVR